MSDEGTPSFTDVCRYAGQLFLETRHRLEALSHEANDLRRELALARKERDDALALLTDRKG
jgi:hypothetical protein